MNESTNSPSSLTSRRDFIKTTGTIVGASALAGVTLPHVHAVGSSLIQIALIGCGGRGSGAADNALNTKSGPVKLVAMADVFKDKLDSSYNGLKGHGDKIDVPADRKFIGFDGYKKAMDCLKPGDVAIFTTPLAFRWVHLTYAIQKGINVFMEKPLTADGPSSKKMLELAKQSVAKNLKVGVGLMSRHSRAMQQLHQRIQDGEIGDLILLRGYRMHGPVGSAFSTRWTGEPSELLWQIRHFHSFLWASGGCYNDFYIHHVDHLCWMKNAWPVKAQALGGRHYRTGPRGDYVDQNFDSYSVEYTFPDGTKMMMDGRCMDGAHPIYSSYAHGSKGMAIVSNSNDCDPPSRTFKTQNPQRSSMNWESKVDQAERNPYQNEWEALMEAIRNDKPHNEAERGVQASVVCNMGRMAAHTAQEITFEDALNAPMEMAPGADKWTMDSPPPVVADKNGKYPVPQPGILKDREY